MTNDPPAVWAAIRSLMQHVTSIPKGHRVTEGAGGYAYRGIDDLLDTIGAAARTAGVMIQSEIVSAEYDTQQVKAQDRQGRERTQVWTSSRLCVRYRFTSLDDGSTLAFESVGEGRDNSDKSASKAMSMALKYALCQALLIPTGDPDPDSERPTVEPAPSRPKPAADIAGRAVQALTAARNVTTKQQLEAIHAAAESEFEGKLLDEPVDGVLLREHLDAIESTL